MGKLMYIDLNNTKHGAGSFSNGEIYEKLSSRMTTQSMPKLFQSLDKTSDLQKLGSELGKLHYKMTASPSDVFKALGLEAAGVKLSADNPKLLEWFRHTMVFRTGRIGILDEDIHKLLSSKMSEGESAALYHRLNDIADLKPLGEKLQEVQLRKWVHDEVHPDVLRKRLGGFKGSREILLKYEWELATYMSLVKNVAEMRKRYPADDPGAYTKAALAAIEKSHNRL